MPKVQALKKGDRVRVRPTYLARAGLPNQEFTIDCVQPTPKHFQNNASNLQCVVLKEQRTRGPMGSDWFEKI